MLKLIFHMSLEIVDIYMFIYIYGSFVNDVGKLYSNHVVHFKPWFCLMTLGGTRWILAMITKLLKRF